ncbi:hypothetical protein F4779DRAFT_142512 [Xylariaceae sp. FL0662B]|nr:hypothetical protein F4779DRAFT_142512 [Xylariaceae sp. FL0662B]
MSTTPKSKIPKSKPVAQRTTQLPRSLQSPAPKRVDPSSPAYKRAARRHLSFVIATPILLVTSYVLFERLVLGKPAKTFDRAPIVAASSTEKKEG